MRHIESDSCKVITLGTFQRERAERAIEKDAMEQHLSTREGSTIYQSPVTGTSISSELEEGGGMSLLDNDQPSIERDWQGHPILPPKPTSSYNAPLIQPTGSSVPALSKFPALPTQSNKSNTTTNNSDLLDLNEASARISTLSLKDNAWFDRAQTRNLFPNTGNAFPTTEADNKYDALSEITFHTDGTHREPKPLPTRQTTSPTSTIPPSSAPENTDPNHPHARIRTTYQYNKTSTIDLSKFWDPIREAYECPGTKCLRLFPTPEAFKDHLLTDAHVGGHVTCPSCLNRFKTTSALVSHMESGARGCSIRHSTNYNQVLREVSAGLLGTGGHLGSGDVRYVAPGDEGWDYPGR